MKEKITRESFKKAAGDVAQFITVPSETSYRLIALQGGLDGFTATMALTAFKYTGEVNLVFLGTFVLNRITHRIIQNL